MVRKPGACGLAFLAVAIVVASAFLGCSRPIPSASESPPKSPSAKQSEDKAVDVYALVRAGATEMSGAIDSIAEALDQAKKAQATASGKTRQALDEVVDRIDGVGETLADYSLDPPQRAEFEKRVPAEDERRLAAIQAANDGIHELQDASGIARSLLDDAPPAVSEELKKLAGLIDLAIQDVSDAVAAFGGTVENE